MLRRSLLKLFSGSLLLPAALSSAVMAGDMPAPFDKASDVKIALIRFLSTGDFFQAYLSGVETQAAALGVDLRVFDSRQDAALQADIEILFWGHRGQKAFRPKEAHRQRLLRRH